MVASPDAPSSQPLPGVGRSETPPRRAAPGLRFPRARRIGRGQEIRQLLRRGARRRTAHFDVYRSAGLHAHARFGVIVPKYKHNSVERNRLKRRLREVARQRLLPPLDRVTPPADILVRARPGAYDLTYLEIEHELAEALKP